MRSTIAATALATLLATACGTDAGPSTGSATPATTASQQDASAITASATIDADPTSGASPTDGPAAPGTVAAWLEDDGRFTTLVAVMQMTPTKFAREDGQGKHTFWSFAQVGSAENDFRFTLFAPTDAAFEDSGLSLDDLLAMGDAERNELLGHHVVDYALGSDDFSTRDVKVWGGDVRGGRVALDAEALTWAGHTIVEVDHVVDNWVVHVVDGLAVPGADAGA